MRINFVYGDSTEPDLLVEVVMLSDALVDIDEDILASDVGNFADEEADMNIYLSAEEFDPETTTETAVIVTDSFLFDSKGESILDLADRIACTSDELQEAVYMVSGRLTPVIDLGEDFDFDSWSEFVKEEVVSHG